MTTSDPINNLLYRRTFIVSTKMISTELNANWSCSHFTSKKAIKTGLHFKDREVQKHVCRPHVVSMWSLSLDSFYTMSSSSSSSSSSSLKCALFWESSSFWHWLPHWQRSVQVKFFVLQEHLAEEQSALHWHLTNSPRKSDENTQHNWLRAHTTSYSTLIETMRLSCTVFEI